MPLSRSINIQNKNRSEWHKTIESPNQPNTILRSSYSKVAKRFRQRKILLVLSTMLWKLRSLIAVNQFFFIQFTLDVCDLRHLNSKALLHQYMVITYKHCLTWAVSIAALSWTSIGLNPQLFALQAWLKLDLNVAQIQIKEFIWCVIYPCVYFTFLAERGRLKLEAHA